MTTAALPGPVIGGRVRSPGRDHFVAVVDRDTTLLDIDPPVRWNR
jgi:hypothetical protein